MPANSPEIQDCATSETISSDNILLSLRASTLADSDYATAEILGTDVAHISAIKFGGGVMRIDVERSPFRPAQIAPVILSTVGYSAEQAARRLGKSPHTIRGGISDALTEVQSVLIPSANKLSLARFCLRAEMYELGQSSQPLGLTIRQQEVVESLSYGFTSRLVGQKLSISGNTVDTYVQELLRETGLGSREQLVLASLLSREVTI